MTDENETLKLIHMNEVEAEQIRKGVDTIMREETRKTQPKRAHDMEL